MNVNESEKKPEELETPAEMKQAIEQAVKEGKSVNVDKDGNVTIGEQPGNVVEIGEAKKGLNKVDIARIKAFEERIRRHINKNPTASREDAIGALQKEDWDNAPVGKKIARLVEVLAATQRQMQIFNSDMMNLRFNDQSISDAFQINYNALSKMFMKLGLTGEQQKECMLEAQKEFDEQRKTEIAAREEAQRKKMEEAAQQQDEKEKKNLVEQMAEKPKEPGAEPPKDATVFGG